MVVPEGEGVIIAIGQDDGGTLLLHALQVVGTEIPAGVTSGAVVIIPGLAHHLQRDQQAEDSSQDSGRKFPAVFPQQGADGCRSHAYPHGKGIEGAGIGIVPLPGLERCLVDVDHNGQSCHEEQQSDHEGLLLSFPTSSELPAQSQQS